MSQATALQMPSPRCRRHCDAPAVANHSFAFPARELEITVKSHANKPNKQTNRVACKQQFGGVCTRKWRVRLLHSKAHVWTWWARVQILKIHVQHIRVHLPLSRVLLPQVWRAQSSRPAHPRPTTSPFPRPPPEQIATETF